jgi:hypothetical protein
MMDSAGRAGEQSWDWVRDSSMGLGSALIFARGVTPERVIEAFRMDPATAQVVPERQVTKVLPYPVYSDGLEATGPYLRIGWSGDWIFVIDPTFLCLESHIHGDRVAERLSAGTEVAIVTWTAKPTESIEYWVDGGWMTLFEPYMAYDRAGADPDRFVQEMRQVGLETERPGPAGVSGDRRDEPGDVRDTLIAGLNMLTLALGIRLSEDAASGPLLTVQRRFGAWRGSDA